MGTTKRCALPQGGILYALLWMWIGLAGSWDLCLAVHFRQHIQELNPQAQFWLDTGGIAALALAKMFGTVLVLGVLCVLWHWCRRFAWIVIVVLSVFQAGLLAFQYLA